MQTYKALARTLGACLLTGAALSAQIGKPVPTVEFVGFGNTEAKSLEDFSGRLILLESFAHW